MVSLEWFILSNTLMNLLILAAGARGVGHLRRKKLLKAAALGTAYSVAAFSLPVPEIVVVFGMAAVLFLMAGILFEGRRQRRDALFRMIAWAAATGGVQLLINRWTPHDAVRLFGGAAVCGLFACCSGSPAASGEGKKGTFRMRIGTRMGEIELEALLDTGNSLIEPLSGLPVAIVGSKRLEEILGPACCLETGKRIPVGFRKVSYGTLNGAGEMSCFRPESVLYEDDGRWREAGDVWIAVYPGRLPSDIGALAPPSLFGDGRSGEEKRNRMPDGNERR